MKVKDCVSLTMKIIGYILDNSNEKFSKLNLCNVENSNNFNKCHLGIDRNGFYIEEEKRFNGNFSYIDEEYVESENTSRIPICPYYVVRLLFEREKLFQQMDTTMIYEEGWIPQTVYSMNFSVSSIIRKLDIKEDDLAGCIESYRKIVDLISEVRTAQGKGEKYPVSYKNLMNELNNINVKNYNSIANKIKKISKLNYDDIACIALREPQLARTIAIMYQIEKHLIEAARNGIIKNYIENYDGYIDYDYIKPEYSDNETILNTDVSSWDEFCKMIYLGNYQAIKSQNNLWKIGYERGKVTTFGLDEFPTPGTPDEYSRKDAKRNNHIL